jgi:hypothetical protein
MKKLQDGRELQVIPYALFKNNRIRFGHNPLEVVIFLAIALFTGIMPLLGHPEEGEGIIENASVRLCSQWFVLGILFASIVYAAVGYFVFRRVSVRSYDYEIGSSSFELLRINAPFRLGNVVGCSYEEFLEFNNRLMLRTLKS